MHSLQQMKAANNKLTILPGLDNLPNLSLLDLSQNNLDSTSIRNTFTKMLKL